MTEAPASSMRKDVASAYAATAAKILSWVIVSGLVYRFAGVADFAMLALIRGTIGILNYTALGLAPAMVRMIAEAKAAEPQAAVDIPVGISYSTPETPDAIQSLYANGLVIAIATGAIGVLVSFIYARLFDRLYHMPFRYLGAVFTPVLLMGCGTVFRLMSDAPGSLLQASGRIGEDNWRIVEAEAIWVCSCTLTWLAQVGTLNWISSWFAISGVVLCYRRSSFAAKLTGLRFPRWVAVSESVLERLLAFGALVLFAQLADYLYAPTDYILINRLLGWEEVAVYTPAMQIDAGLLLLVTGLSSVILPRTALAHTAGEMDRVRRYYVYGTFFSAALLLFAGVVVYLASPLIFRLWLGDSMRPTQIILPLVLIHTIVGGSSAVGRSILLGMGKVRAFTIAVLIAGVSNVILSYIFVRHLHLGLKGIVLGTIVAVVGRCAIWMPWYVLRSIKAASIS